MDKLSIHIFRQFNTKYLNNCRFICFYQNTPDFKYNKLNNYFKTDRRIEKDQNIDTLLFLSIFDIQI